MFPGRSAADDLFTCVQSLWIQVVEWKCIIYCGFTVVSLNYLGLTAQVFHQMSPSAHLESIVFIRSLVYAEEHKNATSALLFLPMLVKLQKKSEYKVRMRNKVFLLFKLLCGLSLSPQRWHSLILIPVQRCISVATAAWLKRRNSCSVCVIAPYMSAACCCDVYETQVFPPPLTRT